MSKDDEKKDKDKSKNKEKELEKDPISADAEKVGWGSPPKKNQWKPGQSGNPSGRPKGSKNLRKRIFDMGLEEITIRNSNGEKQKVTREIVLAHKVWERLLTGKDIKFITEYCNIQDAQDQRWKEIESRATPSDADILRSMLLLAVTGDPDEDLNLEEVISNIAPPKPDDDWL